MKDVVFLFDGQGAFRPGVGEELCAKYAKAEALVERCSEILNYDLAEHLWGETACNTAGRTSIAQPAISTVSLAYAEVLEDFGIVGHVSLGHSLGEATAVIYCGIVSLEEGMNMIKKRGEVMEAGGSEGTMMAVLNIELSDLEKICEVAAAEISEPVVVANINAPNQIVISGSQRSIKRVAQLVVEKNGRGIPLGVGGAWHSPYLKDAAADFANYLDDIEFKKPKRKFYSVVEQKVMTEPAAIKDSLKHQMLSRVDWIHAINHLKVGNRQFLEIGPSKILRDLVARIDSTITVDSVALYDKLEDLIGRERFLEEK